MRAHLLSGRFGIGAGIGLSYIACLTSCAMNDIVTVWKLDRLTRPLKDMLQIMEIIDDAGAGFRSLTESIDTTSLGRAA